MKKHVWLIEHDDIAFAETENMKQELQPDLDTVSGPDDFLLAPARGFDVIEIEDRIPVALMAAEPADLDLRYPRRCEFQEGCEVGLVGILGEEHELITEV